MNQLKPIEDNLIVKNNIVEALATVDMKSILSSPVLGALEKVVNEGMIEIKKADIRSDKALKETADYIAYLKSYRSAYDKIRVSFVDPYNKAVKLVNGYLNPLLKSLDSLENQAKAKCGKWQMIKEEEARVKQAIIDEENRKKAAEYEKLQREKEERERIAREEALIANKPIPEPEPEAEIEVPVFEKPKERDNSFKGANSSASFRKKYTIVHVYNLKLPAEYMVPDMKAIQKIINAGGKIEGVTTKEEKVMAIRS